MSSATWLARGIKERQAKCMTPFFQTCIQNDDIVALHPTKRPMRFLFLESEVWAAVPVCLLLTAHLCRTPGWLTKSPGLPCSPATSTPHPACSDPGPTIVPMTLLFGERCREAPSGALVGLSGLGPVTVAQPAQCTELEATCLL